ncbi:MAG: hypothetical protein IKY33_01520 [Clostridia bacterium]|nr:hypothetical protein [Clostridia bacterium]
MKLKKIESIIKKSKSVAIVEADGAYWIGNERGMYPTYFGFMDLDTLMTMFDLDTEKRESITEVSSELIARADTADYCTAEVPLRRDGTRIIYKGCSLMPLYYGDKVLYIDPRYLDPVADAKEGIECYLRIGSDRRPYVAIKSGMLLVGLIEPEEVVDELFLNTLKGLYDKSSAVFKATPSENTYRQEVIG